jgi:hypothetical protein
MLPWMTVPDVGQSTVSVVAASPAAVGVQTAGVETATPMPEPTPVRALASTGVEPFVAATISAIATAPAPDVFSIVNRTDDTVFGGNATIVGKRGSSATAPTGIVEPSENLRVPLAIFAPGALSAKIWMLVSVGAWLQPSWVHDPTAGPDGDHEAPTPEAPALDAPAPDDPVPDVPSPDTPAEPTDDAASAMAAAEVPAASPLEVIVAVVAALPAAARPAAVAPAAEEDPVAAPAASIAATTATTVRTARGSRPVAARDDVGGVASVWSALVNPLVPMAFPVRSRS